MKGIDTPVLLRLLHGSRIPRGLGRVFDDPECATTELNLFELAMLAARSSADTRKRKDEALARLRRRISVLPIGEEAVRLGSRRAVSPAAISPYTDLIWSAFAAAGCRELLTTREYAPRRGAYPFKVTVVPP